MVDPNLEILKCNEYSFQMYVIQAFEYFDITFSTGDSFTMNINLALFPYVHYIPEEFIKINNIYLEMIHER
jgi:hypothetical protein